jgi:hypothetical protein
MRVMVRVTSGMCTPMRRRCFRIAFTLFHVPSSTTMRNVSFERTASGSVGEDAGNDSGNTDSGNTDSVNAGDVVAGPLQRRFAMTTVAVARSSSTRIQAQEHECNTKTTMKTDKRQI